MSTQIWDVSSDNAVYTVGTGFEQYTTNSGRVVYYSIDDVDGHLYAVTLLYDSTLIIGSTGDIDANSVLELIDD